MPITMCLVQVCSFFAVSGWQLVVSDYRLVLSDIANDPMQDYEIPRIVVMSPTYGPYGAYASTSMQVPMMVSAN